MNLGGIEKLWGGGNHENESSKTENNSGDFETKAKKALLLAVAALGPTLAMGQEKGVENYRDAASLNFNQLTELVSKAPGRVITYADSKGNYKFTVGSQGGVLEITTPDGVVRQIDENNDGKWDKATGNKGGEEFNIDRTRIQTGKFVSVEEMQEMKDLDWAAFDASGKLVTHAAAPEESSASVVQ